MDQHGRAASPHSQLGTSPAPLNRRSFLATAGLTAAGTAWALSGLGAGTARAATRRGAATRVPPAVRAASAGALAVPLDSVTHTRTWMAWPDSTAIYGRKLSGMQANIALIADTIAQYEPVYLLANSASVSAAENACTNPNVTVIGSIPVDDCWMRDSGPVFRTDGAGGIDAVGLNFNGWGGKQKHANDALVAERVADFLGVDFTAAGLVSEGGAIETDGAGTVMATRSSIINSDRNPGMTQAQIEQAMCAAYGASKVIWFTGISGQDITDDHVDATSRFLAPGGGLVQTPNPADPSDIWSKDEQQQYQTLSTSTDAQGDAIAVTKLQSPDYNKIRQTSVDFVDSYANYYVCNGAVISAQFGDSSADANAKAVLRRLFPGRTVVQLNIDNIGNQGGGIHCVTQPQPAP
ncbi:agmatine deiminase family protein [Streptomyces sp. PTM05]|uniref:Agmatine deiminase family protein n=1 Tax=Streptantibioticus parmotrematis TaxID=2873249 RepID=A0ABS7QUL1_9ACTN|nr:agmatine deiminase family protein [Streptantibioticus parmotrematis]MBY8886354.1 agmatine deiminase family protein [Streptantibioticus parmotrematis]